MKNLERIMVGLDSTPMDDQLISYTSFLCDLLTPGKVYFMHIERTFEMPEEMKEVKIPIDEKLREDLSKKVKAGFNPKSGTEYSVEVEEGQPMSELLHWSQVKKIDLMIFGLKRTMEGSGIVPQELARKTSGSFLFVPEGTKDSINRILVPVDFSKHSREALDVATILAKKSGAIIFCQHIFEVPTGYYKMGKSYDEFAAIMKENARKKMEEFISGYKGSGISIETIITHAESSNPGEEIISTAKKQDIDFIISGSKGRTAASAILLGSVAEKIVKRDEEFPLLIIKEKDENLNFLEALLKI